MGERSHTTPAVGTVRLIRADGGVRADGAQLAVYERGEAAPDRATVVLAHGWPDSAAVWDPVAERLAGQFHVVTFDMRGVGRSTGSARTGRPYAVGRLAEDLDAVVAAASPDAPVHLVGHDWGSVIGWEYAMGDGAARLASFTSLSGPNLDAIGSLLRSETRREARALASQAVRSAYTLVLSTPVLSTVPWRLGADRAFRRWLRLTEGIDDYPGSGLADDAVAAVPLYRTNIASRLVRPNPRPVTVPVQLIVATRDRYVSPRLSSRLGDDLPDVTRRELDAGHWSPRTHPDQIATFISEFVDSIEPS